MFGNALHRAVLAYTIFSRKSVTRDIARPEGHYIMKISEHYRLKALACEKLGRDAEDFDQKCAWRRSPSNGILLPTE